MSQIEAGDGSVGEWACDLSAMDDRRLFAVRVDVMTEFRRRGLVRSSNNPTGDYAEVLVGRELGVVPVGGSELGYDLLGPSGRRIQVKSRRAAADGRVRGRFSPIRDIDARHFDEVIVVVRNQDGRLEGIGRFGFVPPWLLPARPPRKTGPSPSEDSVHERWEDDALLRTQLWVGERGTGGP